MQYPVQFPVYLNKLRSYEDVYSNNVIHGEDVIPSDLFYGHGRMLGREVIDLNLITGFSENFTYFEGRQVEGTTVDIEDQEYSLFLVINIEDFKTIYNYFLEWRFLPEYDMSFEKDYPGEQTWRLPIKEIAEYSELLNYIRDAKNNNKSTE